MTRWRPSRAGILNVWRYHDETFAFHEGRLLLKGPNGTGKSKALELLLFLFDASLDAGDRTMHWNLMGEGGDGIRAGYVWLEFRKGDEWFTCGARLQASASTTDVQASYFTTGQRIGDLLLTNDVGRPLTRVNLARAIGEHGEVHGSPADYRAEIRTTLFAGMSEPHYDSLTSALRTSERLDPNALLSRLLPPLDTKDESLERQREKLRQLDEAREVVETMAGRQRDYARQVLRDAKTTLTTATARLSGLSHTAEQEYQEQQQALTEATHAEHQLTQEAGEIDARLHGMLSGERLAELRKQLTAARTRAEHAKKHAAGLRGRADEDAELATNAADTAHRAQEAADAAKAQAQEAAQRAGMSVIEDRHQLGAAVDARTRQITELRRTLVQHGDLVQAEAEETQAAQALETARKKLDDDLAAWALRCRELVVVELARDRAQFGAEVGEATARVREELSGEEWRLDQRRPVVANQLGQYRALHEKLANQADVPPPAPHTREADRATAAGAPLWRLVEFRPHMPLNLCAALEAALEASGLLDAWITPDGPLHLLDHDTFAEEVLATPAPGGSLLDVLVPEGHAVYRLLEGIAFGESAPDHPAAVGADGTWRLGSLRGRWAKAEPTYIGVTAREKATQRRLAELATLIDKLQSDLDELDEAKHRIAARREALASELAELPDHSAVDEAHALHTRAQVRSAALREAIGALDVATSEHDVLDAVIAFRTAGDRWLDERREADIAEHAAATAKNRAMTSREHADEADRIAAAQKSEEEELVAALGNDSDRDELDRLRSRRQEITTELEELRKHRSALERLVATLDEKREAETAELREATAASDAAETRFRHLTGGQLPGDAQLDLGDIEQLAPRSVRDAERQLTNSVQAARLLLSNRVALILEPDEDVTVLTVTLDRKPITTAALREWLHAQRDQLTGQLVDETPTDTGVAERTQAAEELARFVNQHLEKHRVRLVWQVDRFVLQIGGRPLTKRMHGALSASEQAMVRYLALAAVVAAHHQAAPDAPRMIMLDDVFAAVDGENRDRLLELLVAFDLDLVLTSDHDWCDHHALPGIAIHQLVTGPDDDAVTTVRFTWSGKT